MFVTQRRQCPPLAKGRGTQARLSPPARRWLSVCAALVGLLGAAPAAAGILVEAALEGVPVRIELGADPDRAVVTLNGRRQVLDLAPVPAPAGYRLVPWSAGPLVAGYGTTYHALLRDEAICAEVLKAPWMAPFLRPAALALAALQVLEPTLAPSEQEGCGAMPFALYARDGWPMMVGWKDAALFVTTTLRFDHPAPAELSAPAPAPSVLP